MFNEKPQKKEASIKYSVASFFSAAFLVGLLYLIWMPISTVSADCCKNCGHCKTSCTTRRDCTSPNTCVVYFCNVRAYTPWWDPFGGSVPCTANSQDCGGG